MYKRSPRSHINADGAAKATFPSEDAARTRCVQINAINGKRLWPYLCEQRPDHWHLTSDQPDLKTERSA